MADTFGARRAVTTLRNTFIDLSLDVEYFNYYSSFSFDRLILNRIIYTTNRLGFTMTADSEIDSS